MPITGKFKTGHKQIVSTDEAPAAIGPYNQATMAHFGYEKLVAVSGQLPIDPTTSQIVPGGIKEQTRQALENIKAIVEESGSTLEQVMKVEIFYTNVDDFKPMNEIYAEFFPDDAPARQAVIVLGLPHPDAVIEISAWVLAGPGSE